MADTPQLVVALSARIDKFEKDLKEAGLIAEREVKGIEGKLGNIGAGKDLLGGVVGGAVGGLVSQLPGLLAKAEDGFAKLQEVIVKLFPTAFPQFEQMNTLVKTHGEIVAGLKDSYGEAAKGIREFSRESVAVLEARQSIAVLDLEANLQRLTRTMTDMTVRALPSLAEMEQGISGLGATTVEVVGKFKPFETAIRALHDGFAAGTPDIRAFREAVARIAQENQSNVAIQLLAKELLALTTDANNAQRALDAIAASMRQVGLDAQNAAAQGTAFRDAMTKLGRVAPTPVSSREAAKLEHDAAMLAASGTEERRAAMVAYQAALKRVNEEEKRRAPAAPADAVSSLERFDDQMSRHVGLLKAETDAVGQTVEQREKLRATALLEEAAKRDGLTIEQAMTAERAKQIEQAGKLKQDVVTRQAALSELNSASREFGSTLAEGFKGLVLEGKKFDEVLKSITNRLTSKAIDKAFDLLFAPAAGSNTTLISQLLKGLTSPAARQAGGPVSSGTPYMVGERGPELFVPNRGGIIVPNNATRGGGGGTVKQTVVVNDYSGQAKVRQTNTEAGGGVEVFVPAIEQMLAVGVSRGRGALSKSVDARRRGTNLYG